eukprot:TRINITY_DN2967_c0_g1_i1.p1 TRINITY_DN2967_c0_g1~~TRINITY_DN2967_c0_g1_i1.p1  ORF type:complete len:719 (+),score=76.72 TRINITY_DN2967_c0_g1_i1:32-2158(+)
MEAIEFARLSYCIGGGISLFFCLLTLLSYRRTKPEFRQSPSDLLFWRTICDSLSSLIYCAALLWYKNVSMNSSGFACQAEGFATHFSMMSSSGWWLIFSVDLLRSVRNPFDSPSAARLNYHMFVWSTSIGAAVLLLLANGLGVSTFGFCWIKIQGSGKTNPWNWFMFYVPLTCCFIYSVCVLVFVGITTRSKLPKSHAIRLLAIKQGVMFTFIFVVYWAFAGAVWWARFLDEHKEVQNNELVVLFAVVVGLRGFCNLTVWLLSQKFARDSMKAVTSPGTNTEPGQLQAPLLTETMPLKWALRKDVMISCQTGIAKMVELAHEVITKLPSNHILCPTDFTDFRREEIKRQEEQGSFEFTDFAPVPFYFLRKVYGIEIDAYVKVFQTTGLENEMLEKFSEGRSGSFFYFTANRQYIVKTITDGEHTALLQLLPDYFKHFKENPDSLISKFFGLHAIKMHPGARQMYFVVMENVFQTSRIIHETYDLKGSWVDRCTTELERRKQQQKHLQRTFARDRGWDTEAGTGDMPSPADPNYAPSPRDSFCEIEITRRSGVMKDLDLNKKIFIGPERKATLVAQVRKDSEFFQQHNIMDYSLLLGIYRAPYTEVERLRESRSKPSESTEQPVQAGVVPFYREYEGGMLTSQTDGTRYTGDAILFVGIIDILQKYNLQKKMERYSKVYLLRKKADGLSSIAPPTYSQRFVHRVATVFA